MRQETQFLSLLLCLLMNPINPQKISEKQVEVDGLKINYKTIGEGESPIVLLHGWGVSSDKYLELACWLHSPKLSNSETRLWSPNAKRNNNSLQKGSTELSPLWNQQDFQILIPDLPGFGKSDEPRENWDLDDFVEFVDKFIKKTSKKSGFELVKDILKEKLEKYKHYDNMNYHSKNKTAKKIILIGHSFGGRIAIKYAAKYPEKVDKLILTGAAGIKHKLTVKQKALFILTKIGKVFFSLPVINHFQKPVYNIFSKIARSRKKDYYNASSQMKEIMKNVLVEDLTDYLGKIKTPTLLVWGKEDKTTPLADGEIMKFKIQNSKLKVIEDANHSLPYQKAEEFADIVGKFIK